jgi:hypothetical protein
MQTRRAHHELARKSPVGTLPPSPCGLRRTSRFAHFRHLLVLPPSFRAAATAAEPGTHNHDREYGSRLALRAPRNDHGFVERSVQTQLLALAAHHARVCPGNPSPHRTRAQGRPGAGRARGLRAKKHAVVTTGLAENARPSPRDGLAAYTRSPWGPAVLPPSSATRLAQRRELGISAGMPGPRDFTVASETFVRMIRSRCDQIRPPHPAPDVRDDREAPLV